MTKRIDDRIAVYVEQTHDYAYADTLGPFSTPEEVSAALENFHDDETTRYYWHIMRNGAPEYTSRANVEAMLNGTDWA